MLQEYQGDHSCTNPRTSTHMANKIVMVTNIIRVWLAVVVKVMVKELLWRGKLRLEGEWLEEVET